MCGRCGKCIGDSDVVLIPRKKFMLVKNLVWVNQRYQTDVILYVWYLYYCYYKQRITVGGSSHQERKWVAGATKRDRATTINSCWWGGGRTEEVK